MNYLGAELSIPGYNPGQMEIPEAGMLEDIAIRVKAGIKEAHPEYTTAQVDEAYINYQNGTAYAPEKPVKVVTLPANEEKALASVFDKKSILPLLAAGAGAFFLFS